jgi:hypothetical protein
MALKHILTLALVLLPSAGRADCEGDARSAREMILASGPFEYRSRQWNEKFDRLEIGLMEANKAYHMVEMAQNNRPENEIILIGDQSWENDGFGWLGPHRRTAVWFNSSSTVPLVSYEASSAKCLGTVVVEERSLIGYEQNAKIHTNNYIEKFFVEPSSGLTVRYERVLSSGVGFNVVSTYRYDASIKIEPPKVDLAGRQRKSLQAFEQAVASADPRCRQEVIEAIYRGQTAPFHYEIAGGVNEIRGTFVPPSSVHNIVDCHYCCYGGVRETLMIDGQAWRRLAGEDWVSTTRPPPSADDLPASWFVPGYIVGAADHVGGAKCLGEVERTLGRFRSYEYEMYRDGHSMRKFVTKRRMFVDLTTGLPRLFENLDHSGQIARLEVRTYEKGITLAPPVIALDRIAPKALPRYEQGSGLY